MTLTTEKLNSSDEQICDGDSAETIEKNPKSWAAWKREAERLQAIVDANQVAAPVGYFVRHRSTWNNPSTWSMWTECSGEDYAEYCKRIATGEADAGRFYEARILYDAPPAPQSTNAADWGINMQTGTPILVYKNCSVIESEQAHYVLSLINSAATPAPAVPPEATPEDIPQEHNINTYSGITWAAAWNACRAAMLASAPGGGNG
ncbi:hypothetical protein PTT65_17775 [Serratia ureilytica]|uniref:hypothetical protein n=1 Tax=Serratia ureilytica TaxID=300181 RepID=UPI00313DE575